jgi:two-component system, chemotaxis family, protein-glutamate methylesterase/glutaminase
MGMALKGSDPPGHAIARPIAGEQGLQRDIIVIGGSAGSFGPLRSIVQSLPKDFAATLFVVVHVAADAGCLLDPLLSRAGHLEASNPKDGERIGSGHIYVARPDHHLTLEDGRVRVLKGPRENRHRPAIDPLFRSAARIYGPRVVAVLLSGLLDDGSAGLLAVRRRGGVAIVQDPEDARWEEMPRRALQYAGADYILPAEKIGPQLQCLTSAPEDETMTERKNEKPEATGPSHDDPEANLKVARSEEGQGTPSAFACPECHGVLWELKEEKMVRFRCRVGHSYAPESLFKEFSHTTEAALWAAMRALEEKAAMQRRIADSTGMPSLARRLQDQSASDEANAKIIREMIFHGDEQLEKEGPAQRAAS